MYPDKSNTQVTKFTNEEPTYDFDVKYIKCNKKYGTVSRLELLRQATTQDDKLAFLKFIIQQEWPITI